MRKQTKKYISLLMIMVMVMVMGAFPPVSFAIDTGDVPGVPRVDSVVAGHEQAAIYFTPPLDGGSPTGYKVEVYIDDALQVGFNTTYTTNPIIVAGLENGISYAFKLIAVNATGPGTATDKTTPVTPSLTNMAQLGRTAEEGVDKDYSVDGNTYTIYTALGLAWVSSQVNISGEVNLTQLNSFSGKTIELAKDITLPSSPQWTPIGGWDLNNNFEENSFPFEGTFDGKGYTISGMKIGSTSTPSAFGYNGFFGVIDGGTVKNLTVAGTIYSGDSRSAGMLVGESEDGIIDNCDVTGDIYVTGLLTADVGGAVGSSDTDIIEDSSADVDISVVDLGDESSFNLGGFIGYPYGSTIDNCTARGDITVDNMPEAAESDGLATYAGGFAGYMEYGTVTDCDAEGNISIGTVDGYYYDAMVYVYAGGFIGSFDGGTISKSLAKGSVLVGSIINDNNAEVNVGGFVGYSTSYLYDCGAEGAVTGGSGLVGSDEDTVYESIGGFVGLQDNEKIRNSYATGNVIGGDYSYVGGFAGDADGNELTNIYATGNTSAGAITSVGGTVGLSGGSATIGSAFYNSSATQTSEGVVNNPAVDQNDASTSKSSIDMQLEAFVTILNDEVTILNNENLDEPDYATWKILSSVNNGYPVFSFRVSEAPASIVAYVANVDVSGTKDTEISAKDVVITLENDTLAAEIAESTDLKAWITNIPAGLTAVAKSTAASGATEITITIAGTPTAVLSTPMAITIPSGSLTSEAELAVTENSSAKFTIVNASTDDQVYHHHSTVVVPEPVKNLLRFNIGNIDSFLKLGSSPEELKLMDAAPILFEDRTLLPIRFVVEPLGGTITWNSAEQKVTIIRGGTTIELWIGNNVAKVNGIDKIIDPDNALVKPMIVNPGRTMLPLRFISEALGCTVDWDAVNQEILVSDW